MIFTDPAFLFLFLPAVLIAFTMAARFAGRTAALGVLFAASCLFYGGWGAEYLIILCSSIIVNWLCVHGLLSISNITTPQRKLILYTGQIFNFGALAWFKYSFFFGHILNDAATLNAATIAIPIGISFYTFQQAVFLSDAFNRDPTVIDYVGANQSATDKAKGFVRYASFICFFPQLVIGPIVYLKEFAPQIAKPGFGFLRRKDIEVGLFLLAAGLFKKVVLADNLALGVDPVFSATAQGLSVSTIAAWGGALSYYAQLYFDFSGYSDMALGAARLFGVILPINFDSPLKAVGIVDFYRRWHITLTRVISRFLYMPISLWGTRKSMSGKADPLRQRLLSSWIPLLINFEVIALWHGATETFVLFGALHGLWYVAETEICRTRAFKAWRARSSDGLRKAIGRVFFFMPMVLCFSLFRADSIDAWSNLIGCMFAIDPAQALVQSVDELKQLTLAICALAFIWLLPNVYELAHDFKPGLASWKNTSYGRNALSTLWRPDLRWGAMAGGATLFSLYFIGRLPPFLYLGF